MTHHVMSFTYAHKIQYVWRNECHQTIRKGSKWKVGDIILFHTWSGRPYFSKWGQRLETTVNHAWLIDVNEDGIKFLEAPNNKYYPDREPWESDTVSQIACEDFIEGARFNMNTGKYEGGELLHAVLKGKNGNDWPGIYTIIRFVTFEVKE